MSRAQAANRYTAIFDDYVSKIQNRPLLLDHILVSPALEPRTTNGAICHQEYDPQVDPNDATRQGRPSDHRPMLVELS